MYVDGVFRNRKNGPAGTVDNNFPMTVGGKLDCDQIDITCDYFSGQIDYIRFTKAANQGPTADFAQLVRVVAVLVRLIGGGGSRREHRVVRMDVRGRRDVDGGQPRPHVRGCRHVQRQARRDGQPGRDQQRHQVRHRDRRSAVESTVAFVGSAMSAASNNNPTVTVPATAAAGQRLVMALSMNDPSRTISGPTGVTGWTKLDTVAAGTMSTTVWTKVAQAGDPGTAVHTPLSGAAKYTLTVAAYSGVDTRPGPELRPVERHHQPRRPAHAGRHGTRRIVGGVLLGGQVGHHDRLDTGRLRRHRAYGLHARQRTHLQRLGRLRGTRARRNVRTHQRHNQHRLRQGHDVVHRAAGIGPTAGNLSPTADFSPSCTFLDCAFDSSGSVDPDGSIASLRVDLRWWRDVDGS